MWLPNEQIKLVDNAYKCPILEMGWYYQAESESLSFPRQVGSMHKLTQLWERKLPLFQTWLCVYKAQQCEEETHVTSLGTRDCCGWYEDYQGHQTQGYIHLSPELCIWRKIFKKMRLNTHRSLQRFISQCKNNNNKWNLNCRSQVSVHICSPRSL